MTKKPVARNVRIAALMHELAVLSEEMAYAMTQAHVPYVATGQMPSRMREVMERYYAWAKKANEAGL